MEGPARNFRCNPLTENQREDNGGSKGEFVNQAVIENDWVDKKAGCDKENWDKNGIRQELQLSLGWLVMNCGVKRQTSKKCSDDSRQVDDLRQEPGEGHEG